MSVRIRKLYADLVGEDGTACMVYIVRVDARRLHLRMAGAEIHDPGGARQVLRLGAPPDEPGSSGEGPLDMRLGEGTSRFELRFEDRGAGSWSPGELAQDLGWSVLRARAAGEARWSGGSLRGVGYADLVEIRRLPRRLGLARLEWGRGHVGESALVYCGMDLRSGRRAMRAAVWEAAGAPAADCESFETSSTPGGGELRLLTGGGEAQAFLLGPARVLHSGNALDRRRFPSLLERSMARLLCGRIVETRSMSPIRRAAGGAGETGWLVHERVSFVS